MSLIHWLYPGTRFKRWLVLLGAGLLLAGIGMTVILQEPGLGYFESKVRMFVINYFGDYGGIFCGIVFIILGLLMTMYSLREAFKAFLWAAFPDYLHNQVKSVYQRQYLKRGPRIVVVGGGTGLSVLLRGLKEYTSNITAIVSVSDDGGSSGRLRGQFGILPPGDLRNCLVALADTEPAMEKLFNYRFQKGKELEGHNLGNLLITALADLTGNFETAIREVSKVLAIRGRVIPSTLDNIALAAELQDGAIIIGETLISKSTKPIKRVFTVPGCCKPVPEAIEAILEADAVILGPGSLYTSVIPNLLVPGIVEAIQKTQALIIYVCNVMTQPGETIDYTASDHLNAIYRHSAPGLVDCMIVNNEEIPGFYEEKYAREGARAVKIDMEKLGRMNVKVLSAPMIQESGYIRHNPHKLAFHIIKQILDKRGHHPFTNILTNLLLEKMERNALAQ